MRTSPPSPHAADSTSGWSDFWDRTVGQTVAGRWGGETADGVEGVDGRNQGTTPRHTLCVECTYWGRDVMHRRGVIVYLDRGDDAEGCVSGFNVDDGCAVWRRGIDC